MNVDNYTVKITTLEVDFVNSESTAVVELLTEVAEGIFAHGVSYTLRFDTPYSSSQDPELMASVLEKLELIPD